MSHQTSSRPSIRLLMELAVVGVGLFMVPAKARAQAPAQIKLAECYGRAAAYGSELGAIDERALKGTQDPEALKILRYKIAKAGSLVVESFRQAGVTLGRDAAGKTVLTLPTDPQGRKIADTFLQGFGKAKEEIGIFEQQHAALIARRPDIAVEELDKTFVANHRRARCPVSPAG